MKNFELSLTNTYLLNPRTRHLEFKIINNYHLKFKPGQFVTLNFEKNSEIVRRNFSIANTPKYTADTLSIEIAATFVPNGIASTALWNMKIGDHIQANGPFGIFVLKPEDLTTTKRYILVATGTGVTPYRSMIDSLQQLLELPDLTVILILGVRNSSELLYGNEFINFAEQQPKFKFIACYSREELTNLKSQASSKERVASGEVYEYNGYAQKKLTQLNINPEHDLVYLCGNPNMIDESLTTLENLGLPRNKIRREKYISSK